VGRIARGVIRDADWSKLRTLIAWRVLVEPILSSPSCRLQQLVVFIPSHWPQQEAEAVLEGLSLPPRLVPSVEVLAVGEQGELSKPYVLKAVEEYVRRFPNLRELRRVSISETEVGGGLSPKSGLGLSNAQMPYERWVSANPYGVLTKELEQCSEGTVQGLFVAAGDYYFLVRRRSLGGSFEQEGSMRMGDGRK
jgi:hypothetical protein